MFDKTIDSAVPPAWLQRAAAWFRGREVVVLAVGVALQFAVLVGMIIKRSIPHLTGETVLLRVVPVDPRDMFRGDYVILGYDFTRRSPAGAPGKETKPFRGDRAEFHGQTVYVWLVPDEDGLHWRCDRVTWDKPPAGQRFIRGKIGPRGIEAGIESYYVQEGTGKEYEAAVRKRQLSAEVALTADGQAALRALRIR
jgi:uncharacterized membrane-anchored protein